jgi:hypothetical protein
LNLQDLSIFLESHQIASIWNYLQSLNTSQQISHQIIEADVSLDHSFRFLIG